MVSLKTGKQKTASLLFVLLIASVIYLSSVFSPPSLMDDTDAVEAQIGRNMLTSSDYVTARLDGVVYLEKTPLSWWVMDIFYKMFGFPTGVGCLIGRHLVHNVGSDFSNTCGRWVRRSCGR